MSMTTKKESRWKSETASEIETKPGSSKIGFVDSEGDYHVFHDLNILRSLSRKGPDGVDVLEFETSAWVIQILGFKLDAVNALYHDSSLHRISPSPEASHQDLRERDRAFATSIAIFTPVRESDFDDEPDAS
jgi:hypothetical protein